MEQADVLIIGAGVIGLAIAKELSESGRDVLVLDQNATYGRETSSRNSEVLHAGLYYPEDSLKSSLCIRGNQLLYEICNTNSIPYRKTGKLIVANSPDEEEELEKLFQRGKRLGLEAVTRLSSAQARAVEPTVNCRSALLSGQTGIVNSHALMGFFESRAKELNATFAYNCRAGGIARKSDGYVVEVEDMAQNERVLVAADVVINAAGLESDRVASAAGLDVDELSYRLHYCKGEYFSISNRHKGVVSHLVYPAPTRYGLGIHATLNLGGQMRLGPNDFYVKSLDYSVDPSHVHEFLRRAQTYLPFLELDDLAPDSSGIRPKLQAEGEGFRDFVIQEERANGRPGLVNLIGIESPGLTAAPAVACHVKELLAGEG